MELRGYQKELKANVYKAFKEGNRKVLMQLPMGGGKTVVLSSIAQDAINRDGKVFVLAHRTELLAQIKKTLGVMGINAGIIKAGIDPTPSRCQVASVQTLVRRLSAFNSPAHHPRLIIVDEAHHARASTYLKIIDHFPDAFVLGVTATPCGLDSQKRLGDLFDVLVHGPQVQELVDIGSLVPPTYYCSRSVSDGFKIKKTGGDYNKKDLGEAVSELRLEGDLVKEWMKHAREVQTIVFAVNIEHSEQIIKAYTEAGVSAAHLDGNTPQGDRAKKLEAFRRREIRVLSNVGLFGEGFDVPGVGCVQLARPTQSKALYMQMVGRALRPAEGKTHAIVLDHAGCYPEHGNVLTPIHWTLEVSKPKEAKPNWIIEESRSGQAKARIITHDGNEALVKVDYSVDQAWMHELQRLQAVCAQKKYKAGWIASRMLERFRPMTLDQYKILGRVCGYHWKWANNQFDLIQQNLTGVAG